MRLKEKKADGGRPGRVKYRNIRDDRQPKRPAVAFFQFLKDKWASGDFKGVQVPDAQKLAKVDYAALSAAEKKVSHLLAIKRYTSQKSFDQLLLKRILNMLTFL